MNRPKRGRKLWDLGEFSKINLPERVDRVLYEDEFSRQSDIRVLDLPFAMPGQGIRIPTYLAQFKDVIWAAASHEDQYDVSETFGYITVDQKSVVAGTTQRRAGAHSDAYIEAYGVQCDVTTDNVEAVARETGEVSHTYLAYDCLPTEFFNIGFSITVPDCDTVLKTFDEVASEAEEQKLVVRYPAYTLLKLDPYVVHRSPVAKVNTARTFVKISFSNKRYNRVGNTHNPLFDYNWDMTPRQDYRNHPWG